MAVYGNVFCPCCGTWGEVRDTDHWKPFGKNASWAIGYCDCGKSFVSVERPLAGEPPRHRAASDAIGNVQE